MPSSIRLFQEDLDDPHGNRPYEESPGIFICRQCAAEVHHRDAFCRHCKRARTIARRYRQLEELDDGV